MFSFFFILSAEALTPEERKKIFSESIQRLKSTGIEKKVPQPGQQFPDVLINDKKTSEWVKTGPLLIVVYRGGWCPFCVRQLKDIQSHIDQFKKHGVTIIAISPESKTEVAKTKNKNDLSFNLVSDNNGNILRQLGFVFKLETQIVEEYKKMGINLSESQGNENGELPIPATYLVGKDLKVIYGFVDADYTTRPKIEAILASLETQSL